MWRRFTYLWYYPHIPPSPWQFYSVVTKLSSAHHLDWRILLCGGVSNMNWSVHRPLLLDLGLTAVVVTSKRYWISNPSSFFGKRLSKCQGGKLETKRSFYDVLFIIPHQLDKFWSPAHLYLYFNFVSWSNSKNFLACLAQLSTSDQGRPWFFRYANPQVDRAEQNSFPTWKWNVREIFGLYFSPSME